jgi:alanine dehydrogenase
MHLGEKRVILTPAEVGSIVSSGYRVIAEQNCGKMCGFTDNDYREVGAKIVNQRDAWECDGLIMKYKAPMPDEYSFFSPRMTLAALFHAEGNYGLLKSMVDTKLSAYSFEYFETDEGLFPLAFPGGEVAGKSAVLYAAHYLQNHLGGKGKLLCDVVGVPKPRIGIIGYGSVGSAAVSLSVALGCEVIVFGTNEERLRKFQISFGNRIEVLLGTTETYEKVLPTLDVLIGAILISTYDTTALITKEMIQKMPEGSLVVDVTCGYGDGYLPFIKNYTTLQTPVRTVDGLNYIKINNLPSAYHLTATAAYAKNLLPYLFRLLDSLTGGKADTISDRGCIIRNGKLIHREIKKHWDYYEKT